MKKSLSFVIVFAMVCLVSFSAMAAEKKVPDKKMTAHPHVVASVMKHSGKVVSVDAAANSIVVNDRGMAIIIKTTNKTVIESGKEKKAFADITVGSMVKTTCAKKEKDGSYVASKIMIEPAAMATAAVKK